MPAEQLSHRVGRCYAMFFLVYLATALILAFTWPGGWIDETAHLSFIMAEWADPQLFPRYEALPLLAEDSLAIFGDGVNYLNHPSFYYLLLSLFVVPEMAPEAQMVVFRLVNVAISAAAVALLFALSARLFTRYREHFVFAAVIVLTPKVGGTSWLISNDNLALLASALTFLGFVALHRRETSARTATLLGAGVALAALSKLTAGLMLGLVIAFGHLRQWRRFVAPDRALLGYLGLLLVFALIGLSPYLANIVQYGSPIYVDSELLAAHEESLVYRDDAGRHFLSSLQYLQLFLFEMVCRWSALEGSDLFEILTMLLLVGLSFFGLWALRRGGSGDSPAAAIAGSGLLAAAIVLPIHYGFLYRTYLATGFWTGGYFRYYLPLWPALAVAIAAGLQAWRPPRLRAAGVALAVALLIYGFAPVALFRHTIGLTLAVCAADP